MQRVYLMTECGARALFTTLAIVFAIVWAVNPETTTWLSSLLLIILGGLVYKLVDHMTSLRDILNGTTPPTDSTVLLETLIENLDEEAKASLVKDLSDSLAPEEREQIARKVEQKILLLAAVTR
jgi:hypothetical protein